MSIDLIDAWEVTCQHCPASIVVAQWRDAAKHGWAVPVDGALQLCPACLVTHKARLMELCDNSKEPKTMTDGQSDIDYGDDYYAANEQDVEPPPVANKIDAEAIGLAIVKQWCPTSPPAWKRNLTNIIADEIRKALGKADTADITSLATTILSQQEDIVRREESICRLMQNAGVAAERIREMEDTVRNVNANIDRRDKTIKRLDASNEKDVELIQRLRQDIIEKDELVRGLHRDIEALEAIRDAVPEAKESKEPANSPPKVLSDTDEGAMVGAISIYFLDHTEATVTQLAKLAEVTERRIREYVVSADHLSYEMRPIIRLAPAMETPQTPKGE